MPRNPLLRIGILSTAKIAREFTLGVRGSGKIKIAAVASRDFARAQEFAKEFGIAAAHGSYDELMASPDIDAVYNPLPNSLHAEWSIRAMQAGKHVLCEKPLAMTAQDARQMFHSARQNAVRLVEGYPYRSQPIMLKLAQALRAGEIGRVEFIRASFGFKLTDPSNIRLNPRLGGGSLWDVGCYPISLVRLAAQECPTRVHAIAQWTSTGIDNAMIATLEFASGLLAQISCSFATAVHRSAMIVGDAGVVETPYSNHPPMDRPASFRLRRGSGWEAPEETVEAAPMNGFRAEADSFADSIRLGPQQWNGVTEQESIDIALTLEAIERSAKTQKPVSLGG